LVLTSKTRPSVERLNAYAPRHSRLFKDVRPHISILNFKLSEMSVQMIIVASPSKPFLYTAKMTPRRQAILKDYDEEINALYGSAEQTSQVDIPLPVEWTSSQSLDYVRHIIHEVMAQKVTDQVDISEHGCDRYEYSPPLTSTSGNALE